MGIKFAVFTDVHGNSSALKAVLKDIEKDDSITQIYCLGDMVGIGHETNEVLEILFNHHNISFVAGNHDESILNIINGEEPHSKGIQKEHHEWIAERLDRQYLKKLSSIPKKLEVTFGTVKLLFVHYHLNDSDSFLPVDTKPSGDSLDSLYANTNVDIVCFGHHHTIHHFKTSSGLYLNPGSLGCGHKPLAPYAIVEIGEKNEINVQIKEVPYDNTRFLRSVLEQKMPGYEIVLRVFHGNQHLELHG